MPTLRHFNEVHQIASSARHCVWRAVRAYRRIPSAWCFDSKWEVRDFALLALCRLVGRPIFLAMPSEQPYTRGIMKSYRP
jgi:hypothetical protein